MAWSHKPMNYNNNKKASGTKCLYFAGFFIWTLIPLHTRTIKLKTCFNIPTPQWFVPRWHFGSGLQLLALNQTLPIWMSIRGEIWTDWLVSSIPALAALARGVSDKEASGAIWWSGWLVHHKTQETTYPSESMLVSWTMAFRASRFAERQRECVCETERQEERVLHTESDGREERREIRAAMGINETNAWVTLKVRHSLEDSYRRLTP